MTDRSSGGQEHGVAPSQDPRFRTIFDAESAYVWGSLRRLGVAPSDLEDVCQEVFVRVHRHLDSYDPARPLRPWIFGILHRVAAEWRRHRRRHPEAPTDALDPADWRPDAEHAAAVTEARALVERCLAAVHVDRRPVMMLHDLDGVAMPEIARALDLPLNTAYSRLRLAREEFRQAHETITRKGGRP